MEQQPKKREPSIGEKIFDWATYAGINGIGTFLITIPIAYWIQHGGGKKIFDNITKNFPKEGVVGKISHAAVGTTMTMQGGNAMLIPVAIAEHNKVPFVENVNKALGDPTDPATIEEAPQQTIGSLIGGRLLGWCTIFSSFFSASLVFPKTFATFENEFAQRACQLFQKPTHIAGQESKFFKLSRIGALDVFATAAGTTLLYVGGHFFARKAQETRTQRQARRSEHPVAPLTSTTTADSDTADRPDSTIHSPVRIAETLAPAPLLHAQSL